jgi:hypothetical protein
MLYESAGRASAVLALNVEDLDLPNKQAKITAKGGDVIWITWGTDTAHLLPAPPGHANVKLGLAAVHQATETPANPCRRV